MTGWWNARTEREQMLLGAMSAACILFFLYFALFVPASAYKNDAEAVLERALATYADVAAAAAQLENLSQTNGERIARDDRPVRVLASARARELGLSVIRIQPMENDSVSFWLTDASATALFEWLTSLQTDHGITVGRADIQRAPDNVVVQAQVVLRKAQ